MRRLNYIIFLFGIIATLILSCDTNIDNQFDSYSLEEKDSIFVGPYKENERNGIWKVYSSKDTSLIEVRIYDEGALDYTFEPDLYNYKKTPIDSSLSISLPSQWEFIRNQSKVIPIQCVERDSVSKFKSNIVITKTEITTQNINEFMSDRISLEMDHIEERFRSLEVIEKRVLPMKRNMKNLLLIFSGDLLSSKGELIELGSVFYWFVYDYHLYCLKGVAKLKPQKKFMEHKFMFMDIITNIKMRSF